MKPRFPQRLNEPITDARAWTAATLDDRALWYYPLPASARELVDRALAELRREPRAVTERVLSEPERAALAQALAPIHAALESGRGFAILTGLEIDRLDASEAQALYWLLGQALGLPFAQNAQGTLLYDVRDTGQSVAQGARFSVTSAESTFHTDNSFGQEVLDYVGLLCLQTARAGGVNQVVSAYAAHNLLLATEPDALELLYQPFHVDRRGGVKPGESPTVLQPVFAWDGCDLTVRYLRYWIEAGQEKAGQPLAPGQVRALDLLDQTLRRSELCAEFALRRGEIWFMNNRWLLHNRTAFEDHPEPQRQRHLVRLWLKGRAPVKELA